MIRRAIEKSGVGPGPEHACAYILDRRARAIALGGPMPAGTYRSLMDLNYRRSGQIFYRAACDGCTECQAIRVPVETFRMSRSQKRCWKRNQDLVVEVGEPTPTAEKHRLYQAYLGSRHSGEMDGSWEEFQQFLYNSPIRSFEARYHLDGRLIGVGIFDIEEDVVSTVYFYFDASTPQRSLGTFNILWMIEYARTQGLAWTYLGYYIESCANMRYKRSFRPCEILQPDGTWLRIDS